MTNNRLISGILFMSLIAGYAMAAMAAPVPVAGGPVRLKDVSGKTFCSDNGLRYTFRANGIVETSAFGSGTWNVDEFNHVVIRFPTQHIDIAVTKEKTPQGMVYHYVRYGGDESLGSARVCK